MLGRWSLVAAAGGSAAVILVGLASGASTQARKSAAASPPKSWLPPGVTPSGANWPTAGGDLSGTSYSTLSQINASNVSKLKVAFQLQPLNIPGGNSYKEENSPLVVSTGEPGVTNLPMATTMFMETNHGLVALNPTNGDVLWQYQGVTAKAGNALPGAPPDIGSRSIAYGDGLVFGGQQDGSLAAVDAKTGRPVWTVDTEAAGSAADGNVYGESNPWAIFDAASTTNGLKQDLVFSAPNGGDSPMRGHFDAFNAKTGVLVWRAWNTPDPTQIPFILSWGNPAEAAVGGAAAWSLPAVDNTLKRVYYGTGNHYPETGGSPGKALWTDTMMSVDLPTGALKWYFQAVHHDEWDFDLSNPPVRINPVIDGKRMPILAFGNKNGFLYVVNAVNGGAVPNFKIPEVAVPDLNSGAGQALNGTWPTQPEPQGGAGAIVPHCTTAEQAAALLPGFPTAPNGTPEIPTCQYASPTAAAYLVWGISVAGGINWNREAYDPTTNDLYTCAVVGVFGHENASPTSVIQSSIGSDAAGGSITALNMSTNKIDWQINLPPGYTTPGGPIVRNSICYGGTLATAGGIVFATQDSKPVGVPTPEIPAVLYAYDAKTGKQLWSWTNNEGSVMRAQAMTYMVGKKQYIAIMATAPNVGANGTAPPTDHLTVFSL